APATCRDGPHPASTWVGASNGFRAVIANMLTGAVEHSFQDADGHAQQAPNSYCWNVTPFCRLVGRASAQIEISAPRLGHRNRFLSLICHFPTTPGWHFPSPLGIPSGTKERTTNPVHLICSDPWPLSIMCTRNIVRKIATEGVVL